jgi:hypothetical protein
MDDVEVEVDSSAPRRGARLRQPARPQAAPFSPIGPTRPLSVDTFPDPFPASTDTLAPVATGPGPIKRRRGRPPKNKGTNEGQSEARGIFFGVPVFRCR